MARVDTGLGWSCDSLYITQTAGENLGTFDGRRFNKTDNTPAVVIPYTGGRYSGPLLMSTDADAVRFTANNHTETANTPYVKDGVTWYLGSTGFYMDNHPSPTAGITYNQPNKLIYKPNTGDFAETMFEVIYSLANIELDNPTPPTPTVKTYTIIYNANGGSGSMAEQTAPRDENVNLSLNSYVRSSYNFMGWATTPSGPVVYTNGQQVYNLAPENGTITLYAVWETTQYTIHFDANTGTGTMTDQTANVDTSFFLDLNLYTKDNYIFRGWSDNPSGQVLYTDGQLVTNLAQAGGTVTLYAIWGINPYNLSIVLQRNNSENNKIDKNITNLYTLNGVLRSDCSIIDPIIVFDTSSIQNFDVRTINYCTISAFGRSYYIRNIESVRTNLWRIQCHVDVLKSFSAQIKANKAIVKRAESGNAYNLYINDGSLVAYQDPFILTEPFPSGFSNYCFILAVAGG